MPKATPTTNAIQTTVLSDDDLTALLQGAGMIEKAATSNRMKIDGANFVAGDVIMPYNSATKKPAFIGRLATPLREMNAFYMRQDEADYASRPHMGDKFCKSYGDIPEQGRQYAEDGTACRGCPFNPFVNVADTPNGRKCQWRGEMGVQIIPDSGILEGDEPVWLMDFSTTSVIEHKGTKKSPQTGQVSPFNFMVLLARLAQEQASAKGEDPQQAVLKALIAYRNGGVVGEFRLLGASSADNSRTWRIIHIRPIQIIDVEEAPAIEAGPKPTSSPTGVRSMLDIANEQDAKLANGEYDDLPF